MKRLTLLSVAVAIFLGCAATVDYIGDSYPPTQKVDLYFSENDVEVDYKVIGRIIATVNATSNLYDNEKFMAEIKEKACEKGGDGVIVLGFEQVQTSVFHESTMMEETGMEKRRVTAQVIKYTE